MGYDMYVKNPPVEEPDYGTDREGSDRWRERYYFRLNVRGMSLMRRYFEDVLDFECEHAPWPTWNASPDAPDYEEQLAARKAAEAPIRATRSPLPGKVPAFKFGSNDAWLVTPEECEVIAAELRRSARTVGDQEWREIVEDFATFNERAASYGGYEVC